MTFIERTDTSSGPTHMRLSFVINLLLVAIILGVYWQVRDFPFIYYDDPEYVFENVRVQQGLTFDNIKWALTTTHFSNWHPLTWTSHMLDAQLYGNNAGQHHFVNVLLHILNTLLLFNLFRKLTGNTLSSALVAGLFAVHPLHIQSVAWISERKDLLCGLFFFLTLTNYCTYSKTGSKASYGLAFFCYILGLMAKPMIVTLPFLLLLLDYWPLCQFTSRKNNFATLFLEKIPFFLLAGLSCVVTLYAQQVGGSVASLAQISPAARIQNALVSYLLYLWKALIPRDLAILYPHPGTHPSWLILIATVILALITVSALWWASRKPCLLVGWFWFMGMFVPVIGIIQVGVQAMADRYTYLPMIGIYCCFAFLFHDIQQAQKKTRFYSLIALVIICILSFRTWQELRHWQNGKTLFARAVLVTKNNYVAHNNLGYELVQALDFNGAKKEFERALEIDPNFQVAHLNLGRSFMEEGNVAEAISHYEAALKIDPNYADAHNNLGNALLRGGNLHEAAAHYIAALRLNPLLIETYNNLGAILMHDGKRDEAIAVFKKAIQLNPNFREAQENLIAALKTEKDGTVAPPPAN